MKWSLTALALIVVAAAGWYILQPEGQGTGAPPADLQGDAMVAVKLPATLTAQEQAGERAFDGVCAACHGDIAQGKEGVGPPLVHKIYEPGHHSDMAFFLAAKNGVRAHHWKFGSMPPVKGLTRADVQNIIAYVRVLQRENGIN
jgi:mono/diheme cytochrome c family protein